MHKNEQAAPAGDYRKFFLTDFELFEKNLNGNSKSPIHSMRRSAMEYFSELGFPTTHDEEWRFTNITPIARMKFTQLINPGKVNVSNEKLNKVFLNSISGTSLVFLNGRYSEQHSNISIHSEQLKIGNLSDLLKSEPDLIEQSLGKYASFKQSTFTALNTGFVDDGAVVLIPANTVINDPIYVVYISTEIDSPFAIHPRTLIIVGENSRVSVVEHYISLAENTYFTNAVTELVVADKAVVSHTKLQTESSKSYHIGSTYIHQQSGSNLTSNTIMIGGAVARNSIFVTLDGEYIESSLNGLSLATGEQLIDNHTAIDHAKPNCASHELYKAILDGKSKGVFNGKIFVRQDAQKTDAKQTNKTLLLSDNATMNAKPQLEIFADDVKCTHGATIGYLDADAIFYLRSRGIEESIARDILTYAFANDVINRISIEPIREFTNRILYTRLKQGRLLENI
jgi:Fe-S cluster assembly protein SufD